MLTFSQLPEITNGRILNLASDAEISYLLTDSRKPNIPAGTLFFAITGLSNNGHDFLQDLFNRGFRNFVIEREDQCPKSIVSESNILLAENSINALQSISAHHRSEYIIPVIGITGSNGKTIIKEWLSHLLSPFRFIIKSPKSFNSQIGVPLSLWGIQEHHDIGIFEAGISHVDEMQKVAEIIRPTIGLFSNIGSAHNEGFGSETEKIEEKAKLFESCHTIIFRESHNAIKAVLNKLYPKKRLVGWSVKKIKNSETGETVELQLEDNTHQFIISGGSEHVRENTCHAITACLTLGVDHTKIQKGLLNLPSMNMRLSMKEGVSGSYIIDDSYNNDLGGLQAALEFLTEQNLLPSHTVILSDILQSGLETAELYNNVNDLLKRAGVDKLIGIGEAISKNISCFEMSAIFFPNTESFIAELPNMAFNDQMILVKGARKFRFERIVSRLQEKAHGTVLEINLESISHNYNYFKSKLLPTTKIMAMVKAFAYGSGSNEVAKLLEHYKVDYFGVAYADEGLALRSKGISTPIMVMNPEEEAFDMLIAHNLEPEIYSISLLKRFLNYCKSKSVSATIHIKFDTGMHRLGFDKEDAKTIAYLLEGSRLRVASIFSHLAVADEQSPSSVQFTQEQFKKFEQCNDELAELLGYRPLRHVLNSAGIINYQNNQYDMVRLGVGLYGVDPTLNLNNSLESVGALKTTISQIKYLNKGDTVGYARKGVVSGEKQAIATLAIGYADGFLRCFGNGNTSVLVNGKFAPVFGNVCMDMCMIDVTGINCAEGDIVEVFGENNPIDQLSIAAETIPYEILTNISPRVKRVFYRG